MPVLYAGDPGCETKDYMVVPPSLCEACSVSGPFEVDPQFRHQCA